MNLLLFYEIEDFLNTKYGISYKSIESMDIADGSLLIKTKDKSFEVNDKEIISKIRAFYNKKHLNDEYPKEEVLKELFSFAFKYRNVRMSFKNFKKIYENFDKEDIIESLERMEREYLIERSVTPEEFKRELWEGLLEYSIENNKIDGTISDYKKIPYTIKEIMDLISEVTDTDKRIKLYSKFC